MAETAAHIQPEQITGLILAGGRGMRMGGVDKGLQLLQGKHMVEHVIARLAPQVGRIIINANQNLERYRTFSADVWPDAIQGYKGPLAGMHAGLSHCETEYLLTVPCDAPMLPDNLARTLSDSLFAANADLAVVITGNAQERKRQPVFCLMKKNLLPSLVACLDKDRHKVGSWIATCHAVDVPFDDEAAFVNINTVEEMEQLKAGRKLT